MAQAPSATIHRDAWGVPHVFSDTDAGAVFGMAWALAEDDWPLIEENYLQAIGRGAELSGENAVPVDWMARALRIVPLSIAEYESAPPHMRALLDAWAAGMNRWLEQRDARDLRVLDRIEPWYPLALIRYKYYLNEFLGYAGLQSEWVAPVLERSAAGVAGPALAADSDVGVGDSVSAGTRADADVYWHRDRGDPQSRHAGRDARSSPYAFALEAQFDAWGRRPRGSNQWAVAPSRTADGSTLLLINPHQSFVGVQRYAEIHLDSREGLQFSGLTVFGFLLPYMGNNQRLGWAYTDNYADHSDLYGMTFDDPASALRYRYGDGYRTAEMWVDTVHVRTADGMDTREFRFWSTHHGPIVGIADDGRPLAVRLARMTDGGWFDQWYDMIRARTLEEWKDAVAPLRVAYMNTMYADADGNIGYIYNSAVPRRQPRVDPSGILDGSDPATEWQGFHTMDELPQVWNPESGWLLNTNSTPFTATSGLTWSRDDFPAYMVGDEEDNARAVSSRRVLTSFENVTFDEFARGVWDTRLSEADVMVPALVEEWEAMPASAERDALAPVIERLRGWDRVADTASVETTWFVLSAEHRAVARRSGRAGPGARVDGLASALRDLRAEWGTIDVPWGRLNRHQRPLPGASVVLDTTRASLPVGATSGALGSVFSYESAPFGSAAPRIGRGGNSFVKVIAFGPRPRAASILNYGQSGDPASTHFFDQASLYVRREFKPAWFSRADVEANAVRSYDVR
ncbi:MAG TPA: penicillin acylase family protein [Longimicrobiales bacterium]|nr:penicillin acylase family protein [Longimicrobiales bacterium]